MMEVRKSGFLWAIPLLITVCLVSFPVYAKYNGGTGEPNDPYLIYTAEQMNAIGAEPNDWDKHFKLMADIDLSIYTGTDFNVIGTFLANPFTGVFEGNNHTISNFSYTSMHRNFTGLFRYVTGGGEIKNLGLVDPNIDGGTGNQVSSLIGWLRYGTITNCYVEGGTVSGNENIGGLVGVHGMAWGYLEQSISPLPPFTVSNCYSTAIVLGHDRVGGLVGFNNSGLINNCYASGSISGVTRVGGLVGCNYQGNITNCYATGSVSGKENVGGLAGQNGHYVNNWSFYGTIANCYSIGTVSGQSNTGGFVGLNSKGSIINSFWDIQTSGQRISNGGTAKTTTEMQMSVTFLDWVDCCYGKSKNVWRINEGNDYPRLWWENTRGNVIESVRQCLMHATNPSPPDGIVYEDTWVSLSWSPGDCAVSHRLFFGDNFDDVKYSTWGTWGTFRVNLTSTSYVVGLPGSAYSGGLVPGTTYYWRIDEVNDMHPESPWKGNVWSFTIPHMIAYNPSPPDGAIHEDTLVNLSWKPGDYAVSHDVYFGDNFEDVNQGTEKTFQNNQLSTSFIVGFPGFAYPDGLVPGRTYYWRIDEINDMHSGSPWKGNIWSFWIPLYTAYDPNPHDGATFVDHNISLSWTAGLGARLHSIYFGDDFDTVDNATGNVPQEATTYYPGPLELAKTYYWRVDEFNAERGTETHKGDVWSFTTLDFIVVDDFESYNDIREGEPGSNRIYLAWIDGFANPARNGSVVGSYNLNPPWSSSIVHSGALSMWYSYDDSVGISEATMILRYPRDWTEQGVEVLSLWFYGNPYNDPEPMYVALNDSAVVYHDNSIELMIDTWIEWRIELTRFADQGVNLANVSSITLGFGNRNNPVAGGSGEIWFDDIRLYRPTSEAAQ